MPLRQQVKKVSRCTGCAAETYNVKTLKPLLVLSGYYKQLMTSCEAVLRQASIACARTFVVLVLMQFKLTQYTLKHVCVCHDVFKHVLK